MSNHGHVLVCLATAPDVRVRDVADLVGITERAVQQIIGDLVEAGYVTRTKSGRRNCYRVNRAAPFRHSLESAIRVGEFVDLATGAGARKSSPSTPAEPG
jgi:predicted transcriptional regulator